MPHDHTLAKEIRDVLDLTNPDSFEPDASFLYRVTTYACELADAVHAVVCKVERGELDKLEAPAVEAALHVWDTVIVPQDIPRVPEVFERMIEGQIRGAIPAAVAGVFARFK